MVSALTLGEFEMATPASITHALSEDTGNHRANPTQLCQWVIHVPSLSFEAIPEPEVDDEPMFDIQNPNSWSPWQQPTPLSLVDSMNDSLVQNTFSATPTANLPVSTESISESVQQDPQALILDALRMSIMAGNPDTVSSALGDTDMEEEEIGSINPFHLAAAFLDGGNTCCGTFWEFVEAFPGLPQNCYVNDLGHTILDSLMISILRSHTILSPEHVSMAFEPPHRYPGEEKDICGRWDADSPIIRSLFRHGYARIPTELKHPFCHSSVQAVCHCIIAMFASPLKPNINFPSGLFTRRCGHCGLELKLRPLHTLIVVAFYLAQLGLPGETLFGPLAILVCLLRLGMCVSTTANISVNAILGNTETDICNHDHIDASGLLQAVPEHVVAQWSPACRTGWRCISEVLLEAQIGKDESNMRQGRWILGGGWG